MGKSTLSLSLAMSAALPASKPAGIITPFWLKQVHHCPTAQNLNLDCEFYAG